MHSLNSWIPRLGELGAIALGSAALGASLILSTPSAASAQAAYGSYIGIGGSFGATDGPTGNGGGGGGVIAVRYKFLEVPMSIRGQLIIGDSTVFVPTVSYDVPLTWQTDAYIGVGAALQDGDENSSSPLGNQTSFVIQPGVDYSFPYSNVVLFGNAIIAFDAYKNSNDTAASIQGGVGVRF
ncbi:MAG: hypothetical protein IGS50_21525 [Synechococcales cyanobacterium C42_A2020_086]|jgi:hypothetical protein|nr:hypothetical protein [Synechococcales cyanobacterium C42_A2020_086]